MKLLVSLHDTTPFHLPRLHRAEALFRELGVQKATYLLIPDYHGSHPSAEHSEFVEWCRAPRPFAVDWHLHGYTHLDSATRDRQREASWSDTWKRRLLTAGEGEFLALDASAQRQRLQAGREVFRRCLGYEPTSFDAPAWLFNADLIPLLTELGFRYTEDHGRIYRVDTGERVAAPVITWATRTPLRKYSSIAVTPLLARIWAARPVLRVAVHPFDFDHPQTVASIRTVLQALLPHREQCFCRDLHFRSSASD
ncbi:MAG TPA: polysaccharide deacetylase family protein [Xanthobacteraceae bacterium]|nr:polysaccharide deacetylase family protein [Xanthobacteraceae bacterium]